MNLSITASILGLYLAARNELVRLEGATGRIRSRTRPSASPSTPTPSSPAKKSSSPLAAASWCRSPPPPASAPAASGSRRRCASPRWSMFRRSLVYQVAAHTNLFVLSLADGVCQHVAYLGHDPASVTTAPVMIDDYLLVVVNGGDRSSTMRLFTIEPKRSDKPEPWLKLVQEIALEGHVQTPPLVEGHACWSRRHRRRAGVRDQRGRRQKAAARRRRNRDQRRRQSDAVRLDAERTILDRRQPADEIRRAGRARIADAQGRRLRGQRLLAAAGGHRKSDRGGATQAGHARRHRLGRHHGNPDQSFWQTRLASPLADEPITLVGNDTVVAVTAGGGVFRFDASGSGSMILSEPIAVSDPFRIPSRSTASPGWPTVCWPSAAAGAATRSACSIRPAPRRRCTG